MQRNLVKGQAPEFSGHFITGNSVALQDYRGKVLLLHFWATWCSICNLEQDSIQSISQDYPLVSIALDSGNAQEIQAYFRKKSLDYPTLADENKLISQLYGVNVVPTSFIIDRDGNIAFTETGFTSEWGLRLRLWYSDL